MIVCRKFMSWSCGLQDVLQCSDCALSCAMWLLQTVSNYRDWAFSNSGLEVGLPALQLADVGKMRRTAERRFVGHVCLRNPFLPFLVGIPSIHSLAEASSWERQHAPPVLHYGCIMPIPSLQLQKKAPVSCREAKRLVTQSWSPRCVAMQWLCSQLCYVTAAIVIEIELLATVGWKWGCQPCSWPMLAKWDALPKGDLLDMFV